MSRPEGNILKVVQAVPKREKTLLGRMCSFKNVGQNHGGGTGMICRKSKPLG